MSHFLLQNQRLSHENQGIATKVQYLKSDNQKQGSEIQRLENEVPIVYETCCQRHHCYKITDVGVSASITEGQWKSAVPKSKAVVHHSIEQFGGI